MRWLVDAQECEERMTSLWNQGFWLDPIRVSSGYCSSEEEQRIHSRATSQGYHNSLSAFMNNQISQHFEKVYKIYNLL